MIELSKEQVKRLYTIIVSTTGGMGGVRDEAALDSALHASFQTFDNTDLYPSTIAKIARNTHDIVRNHPFVDGNKRIGTYVMLVLLKLNYINVDFSNEDIAYIGMNLANGEMSDKQLCDFILGRVKKSAD